MASISYMAIGYTHSMIAMVISLERKKELLSSSLACR